ncbi:alcohol dehydrogenase catalytic domain-containing protein [Streptomyces sp. NPDC050439]|uniref:alcohol dehydrogenase catalytic domain-containing protein n=1 Tax=unclassified Streptomyces TaxID=2593676 RepID=UPI00344A621B
MSTLMRVMELVRFGDADTAFATRELPRPAPGPGQVLVRVLATSVNPLDLQTRRGDYRAQLTLPAVIGNDVSGVVVEAGPGAGDFLPGDEVWYLAPVFAGQGTYAEFHVVDQALVARKPARLSHVEAAALALVGVTVWEALVERAGVRAGERVLVHGGAGGVGSAAIQVASALGAEVVTTARARDHEFVTELGADIAIDFSAGDYVPRSARWAGWTSCWTRWAGTLWPAVLRSLPTEAGWCPSWTSPNRRTCLPRGA